MSVQLYAIGRDVKFESWKFPSGEVGVKLPSWVAEEVDHDSCARIDFNFEGNHDEIFVVLNLIDALKRVGVREYAIIVVIPYLPYSRQDRVCHPGESFALEVFMNVLATSGATVQTYDVHSKVAEKWSWLQNIPQLVCSVDLPKGFDFLVGPDKGSTDKIKDVANFQQLPHAVLDKERKDGMINITVPDNVKLSGNVCIVDDLADNGGTFIAAAEAIKKSCPNVTNISLYVTHAFFGAGLDAFRGVFDKIYCRFLYNEDLKNDPLLEEI